MKRVALPDNPEDSSAKRHKSASSRSPAPGSSDLFAAHLRTSAHDVLHQGVGTGQQFLSGKASMSWPARGAGKRFLMQTEDGGEVQRFEVKLSGQCKAYFPLLDVTTGDYLEILLKGAVVEKKKESSKPLFLPIELEYPGGVVLRWTKRARKPEEDGTVVDTWAREYEFV